MDPTKFISDYAQYGIAVVLIGYMAWRDKLNAQREKALNDVILQNGKQMQECNLQTLDVIGKHTATTERNNILMDQLIRTNEKVIDKLTTA